MNKRAIIPLIILLISIAFFWMDLAVKIRAINPAVDYAVYGLFCFLVPISIIGLGWAYLKKWLRVAAIVIAVIVGWPCSIVGRFAFEDAFNIYQRGYDASLELLQEVTSGDYHYRLYRTNCGALCAYGLEVRKERFTPFGFKLIRSVWSLYGADDGKLSLVNGDIQVTYGNDLTAKIPQ